MSHKASTYMPWVIGDYLKDTMHLSTVQHGAYLLLLGAYWTRSGPLPDSDEFLAATTRLTVPQWLKIRPVISGFFTVEDGFWRQKRADLELQKAMTKKAKASQSAAAKWKQHPSRTGKNGLPSTTPASGSQMLQGCERSPNASLEQCSSSSSSYMRRRRADGSDAPAERTHTPEPDSDVDVAELQQVEAVWSLYPKKTEVLEAKVAIRLAIRQHGFDSVMVGTRAIVDADSAKNPTVAPPGRFLPRPSEFFAAARFLDDPAQYGPRRAPLEQRDLRKAIEDLRKAIAEHPGNPSSLEGALHRKKEARDGYYALCDQLKALLAEQSRQMAGDDAAGGAH